MIIVTGPDKPSTSVDYFPIKAQFDTASEFAEIGQGARLHVFGNLIGSQPVFIHGPGVVMFDMNSVGQVNIQGYRIPMAPTLSGEDVLGDRLTAAFTKPRRNMSDEHLIITALVRQLGGVASVSEDELLRADKVAHMTSHREHNPHRFVIRVED